MSRIEKIISMMLEGGKDSFLQHALALEYIKIGQFNEALTNFSELLDRDPDYIGSYYHLGKLHESLGNNTEAILAYEKGMAVAKKLKDNHSYNELQSALDNLT